MFRFDIMDEREPPDKGELGEKTADTAVSLAAGMLIDATMRKCPEVVSFSRYPSAAVVFEVPDAGWVSPISNAWWRASGEAVRPANGDSLWDGRDDRPIWVEFRRDGVCNSLSHIYGGDVVEAAFRMGVPVHGFSQRPERFLPRDLWRHADCVRTVARPTGLILEEVAERLWGAASSVRLCDGAAAMISSDKLWLAASRSKDSDMFFEVLMELADEGFDSTYKL